jgi:hypothetical protein
MDGKHGSMAEIILEKLGLPSFTIIVPTQR